MRLSKIDLTSNLYLLIYQKMDQNQQQIKVIVLGDSGVGKSSLLLRFVND